MKKKVLFSGILLAFQVLLGHAQQRLLGGDISLLPSYEAAGTVYRNAVGEPVAPLDFFKEQGWNAVRVRLFVEPSKASAEHKGEGVCQDLDYVTKFGQRIKDMGYQFMLDFHYSDTWADPGKQFMPDCWLDAETASLPDSDGKHTVQGITCIRFIVSFHAHLSVPHNQGTVQWKLLFFQPFTKIHQPLAGD